MEIKIACLFRERLTHAAVDEYMSGNTFYSVANLDGRLGNADQCLTEDIAKFSQHLSHLYAPLPPSPSAFIPRPCAAHRYSQISKPILDIVLMTAQLVWLAKNTIEAGSGNPILEASSIGICAIYFTNQVHAPCTSFRSSLSSLHLQLLRSVAPPLGSLVEEQSKTEGQYRAVQSRVIQYRCYRTCTVASAHTDTQTHKHRHTHTDTQTHRHTQTQTHTHTDTQTHTHTHTDTHARTLVCIPPDRCRHLQ
jgi:ATP-binding cassette, subfamily D (ALD), member 2